MHPSVSYNNQCEAHSVIPTLRAARKTWQLEMAAGLTVPTAPSNSAAFVTSSLPTVLWEALFRSKNFTVTTSGTKYLNALLQAASTKLGATWLSQQPCCCWKPRGPLRNFLRVGLTLGGQTNALILPKYLVHYTCKTLSSFWALILYSAIKLSFLLEEHDRWIYSLMTLEWNDT